MEPHHAHDHLYYPAGKIDHNIDWMQQAKPLSWREFVTKPWIGRRGPRDKETIKIQGGPQKAICVDKYSFMDIAPCSPEDSLPLGGLGGYKYEFQHDK